VQTLVDERTANLQSSYQLQAKINEASRRHIEQLRRLNELKDDFVSTISHELRTPLTKMSVAIRMLKQIELDPPRKERYLGILEAECNQEIKLINDVLTLQQLESNQWQMSVSPIDLVVLIKYTANLFQDTWNHKNLTFTVELPQNLTIISEQQTLQTILQELFTNAGKYATENSNITAKLCQLHDQIQFTITNCGLVITKEDLPHVFEKFRRGDGATRKAIAGTGLGLSLVKLLTEHLGGSISVTSQRIPALDKNLGITSFTLTLPINVTANS
jgi:signal transduction histidine kinase